MVVAHGVDQNFGSSPIPLRVRVDNPWVSLVELTFICLCQFLFFQCIHILIQGLAYARNAPRGGGGTIPEDAARWEAKNINNEW
jgi:hypothetical protein